MKERIVFLKEEDGIVTFQRENKETVIYPKRLLPKHYLQGDIIEAIIHKDYSIEFIGLDIEEMNKKRANLENRLARLKRRR